MKHTLRGVVVFIVAALTLGTPGSAQGIPVFDVGNFAQNVVSAVEAVDQTLTQVMTYQNQLRQYEEIIRNGAAPAVYTWDRITSIQNKLQTIARSLRDYRHVLRDLDDYLKRFADLDYYRGAQCYGSNLSCPESEWKRILHESQELNGLASESRKKTLDQLMKTLDTSDEELAQESTNLGKLQRQAQSADGQMQALQAGNQLSAAEVQQLMQMRAIMVALYRAIAVQALIEQNREARQEAADERFLRPGAKDSLKTNWDIWPRSAAW